MTSFGETFHKKAAELLDEAARLFGIDVKPSDPSNDSGELDPITEVPPVEVEPRDKIEPIIDDRVELVTSFHTLCLFAYEVMRGVDVDKQGVNRLKYNTSTMLVSEQTDETRSYLDPSDVVEFFPLTSTVIGSDEPIKISDTVASNVALPIDVQRDIMDIIQKEAAHTDKGYFDGYEAVEMKNELTGEKQQKYAQEHLERTVCVTEKGLALLTIEFDDNHNPVKVVDVTDEMFDADELFASSNEIPEHQALYQEAFQMLLEHFGSNVPQAPDRFATLAGGLSIGEVVQRPNCVNVTDIKLDDRSKAKLASFLGRTVITADQPWPTYEQPEVEETAESSTLQEVIARTAKNLVRNVLKEVESRGYDITKNTSLDLEGSDMENTYIIHYNRFESGSKRITLGIFPTYSGKRPKEYLLYAHTENHERMYLATEIDDAVAPHILSILDLVNFDKCSILNL